MSDASDYIPPKVWTWDRPNRGQFASINRPIAGPTHEKDLPVGRGFLGMGAVMRRRRPLVARSVTA
jgi:hypothetical protein